MKGWRRAGKRARGQHNKFTWSLHKGAIGGCVVLKMLRELVSVTSVIREAVCVCAFAHDVRHNSATPLHSVHGVGQCRLVQVLEVRVLHRRLGRAALGGLIYERLRQEI